MDDKNQDVVIIGAGVIGVCSAFLLAKEESVKSILVIEEHDVASAASGGAGGFLARHWLDGEVQGPLARRSYDLHKEYVF